MATLDVTVNGDASGAIGAIESTSNALGNLGSAGAAANDGLNIAGSGADKAFTAIDRTGSGLRALVASARDVAPAMGEAAGASAQTATALGGVAAGALIFATAADPIVGALVAITTVAGAVLPALSSTGAATKEASGAAQDAASVFGNFAGSVGAPRDGLEQLAAANLKSMGPWGAQASGANDAASALFALEGASDRAATATAEVATTSQLVAASQAQMQGELRASAGSFDDIAGAAGRAGMSIEAYSNIIGTQTMGSNPNGGLAIAGNTDYSYNPGHASGGTVYGGEATLVGERGPEMFVPSSGGSIIPNGSFGGGGGFAVSVQINGNVYGDEDMINRVVDGIKRNMLYAGTLRSYVGAA